MVTEGEPVDVTRLFFIVSGEHTSLPFAEIRAILEAENSVFREVSVFPRVLCLDLEKEEGPLVATQSSMIRTCGRELFRCTVDQKEIHSHLKEVPYDDYIRKGQSFAVRVKAIGPPIVDTMKLEKEVGSTIINIVKDSTVDLVNPDTCFLGLLIDTTLIFGVKLIDVSPRRFAKRFPNQRPFHHPSTMSPKLARCMINLARVKPGSVILDPFCGAGSILIEAGYLGYHVLGSDVKAKMVRGSEINLRYYGVPFDGLIVGDARNLPFSKVNCIITDPPYGRAASTLGLSPKTLITEFLLDAQSLLPKRGYISLALASDAIWKQLAVKLGYHIIEQFYIREHRNLTREILILQKS
jgi:tRNA (guanine10-N2)-dimethyltransferase